MRFKCIKFGSHSLFIATAIFLVVRISFTILPLSILFAVLLLSLLGFFVHISIANPGVACLGTGSPCSATETETNLYQCSIHEVQANVSVQPSYKLVLLLS